MNCTHSTAKRSLLVPSEVFTRRWPWYHSSSLRLLVDKGTATTSAITTAPTFLTVPTVRTKHRTMPPDTTPQRPTPCRATKLAVCSSEIWRQATGNPPTHCLHRHPPPLYNSLPLGPLPCAPAPNTLRPCVNHQIPRRPVPHPPRRSPRRRRCRDSCCDPVDDNYCSFLLCFLAITVGVVLLPLIATEFKFRKDGHRGQESQVHCRSVVVVTAPAAPAAYGGCG